MSPNRRVCVVLLVGIPCSGKSYFRKFFENYLCGNLDVVLGSAQVWSVCYDDYEDMIRLENNKWKQCRLDIIKHVGQLIDKLKSPNSLGKDLREFECTWMSLINKELKSPDSTLILIDDNMYYRSMRYEYYKLARGYNISFSQISFVVDLQKALKCNRKRCAVSRVPESVIENMNRKLELPLTNCLWEKYSVCVLSYADFKNQDVLVKILICLKNALDNPIQVRDINSNEKEILQASNSNTLHQIDNTLKQLVSGYIKSQVVLNNKSKLSLLSKAYSERRLKILKLIKGRVITLPIDLSGALTKETINLVLPILSQLLFSD